MLFSRGRAEAANDIAGRYPLNIFWDPAEPKLLICEAKSAHDVNDDSFTPRRKYSTIYSSLTKAPVSHIGVL